MTIAGVTLRDLQFGIGYGNPNLENTLGLGYGSDESTDRYPNFPEALVNNGLTNSVAYSMWLDDAATGPGSLLFGGVNTAKYTGELHTLPIPSVNGVYRQAAVLVTCIALQANSSRSAKYESSDLPAYMILDSTLPMTYLPNSIVEPLYKDLGVDFEPADPSFADDYLPCSMGQHNYNLTFTFTSFDIVVSMSELLVGGGDNTACLFSIVPLQHRAQRRRERHPRHQLPQQRLRRVRPVQQRDLARAAQRRPS